MHPTCCRCQGGLRHHPERGTPPTDEMAMSFTTTTVGRGSGCLVGHTGWQGLTQRAVCTRVLAARRCANLPLSAPHGSLLCVPRALSLTRVRLGGVVLTTVNDGWLLSRAAMAHHLGSGVDDSGTAECRRAETWQNYPTTPPVLLPHAVGFPAAEAGRTTHHVRRTMAIAVAVTRAIR